MLSPAKISPLTSTSILAALTILAACSKPPPPSASSSDAAGATGAASAAPITNATPQAASPEPAPASASAAAPAASAIVVGGESGIEEIATDGRTLRTLTKTPASRPRYTPGGGILFVVPDSLEIRRVAQDGTERSVAKIPARKGCAPSGLPLTIHEDSDFVVDQAKGAACVRLMDRNANMADFVMVARVDLATGDVRTAVQAARRCAADKGAAELFDCNVQVPSNQNGKPPEAGAVRGRLPAGFTEESRSPSGRFSLVSGNVQQGDYIHRDLYLIEQQSGKIYTIAPGSWPPPITPAQLGQGRPGATADATGESTIRWLGKGDLLLVDSLLIEPGLRVIELRGHVAQ